MLATGQAAGGQRAPSGKREHGTRKRRPRGPRGERRVRKSSPAVAVRVVGSGNVVPPLAVQAQRGGCRNIRIAQHLTSKIRVIIAGAAIRQHGDCIRGGTEKRPHLFNAGVERLLGGAQTRHLRVRPDCLIIERNLGQVYKIMFSVLVRI